MKILYCLIICSVFLFSCEKKSIQTISGIGSQENLKKEEILEENEINNESFDEDKRKMPSEEDTINDKNVNSIQKIEEPENSSPFEEDRGVILSVDNTNLRFHLYFQPDEL
jgi:hypothetical protein